MLEKDSQRNIGRSTLFTELKIEFYYILEIIITKFVTLLFFGDLQLLRSGTIIV